MRRGVITGVAVLALVVVVPPLVIAAWPDARLAPGLTDSLLDPVGAALFGVSMPRDVSYVYRVRDVDGLTGLVDAKRALYADAIPPDGITPALADQLRVRRRSPYGGSPYRWDAVAKELRFASPDARSRESQLAHPG